MRLEVLEFVEDQCGKIGWGLLNYLEFYQSHDRATQTKNPMRSSGKEPRYEVRFGGYENHTNPDALFELYRHFSKLGDFMFMEWSQGDIETIYGCEGCELEIHEWSELSPVHLFNLGQVWGEYVALYNVQDNYASDRPETLADGSFARGLFPLFVDLKSSHSAKFNELQKAGAKAQTRRGVTSEKVCKKFLKLNYENEPDGRTSTNISYELISQIEECIKLKNRYELGMLNLQEETKFSQLEYLLDLTKNKNGVLEPYSHNTLRLKVSKLINN